jgi:hypothetical protein
MRNMPFFRGAVLLAAGAVAGGLLTSAWKVPLHAQQQQTPTTQATVLTDVTHLRDITPPNSHPMVDVGYHMVNLWFAVEAKNWPLANYYLGETRNRLRWEVRLNPSPKGASGEPVDMKSTLDGIENGSFATVKDAIDKKDANAFPVAYKHLLEDCYSCHKNAGKPYLRPMVPTTPGQPIINTDPNATWPQ